MSTSFLVAAGLGLLGFIEPCTVGSHLLFLGRIQGEPIRRKIAITFAFITARVLTTGAIGALAAVLGQLLIGFQTTVWLLFGILYLVLGLIFISGKSSRIKTRFEIAPASWQLASNPIALGIAFGLNIPACAAPIIFGLLSLAASSDTIIVGFALMAVFGFALSAPLIVMALLPGLSNWLETFGKKLVRRNRLLGLIFVGLGIWSIWFGLFVDPQNWKGQ